MGELMPNDSPTAQEILDSADDAQRKLAAQEKTLQKEIQNIDDIEFDHPLTDEEKRLRENLRTAQTQCRAGMVELAFVTLEALDDSAEVQNLASAFKTINADLKTALDRVKHLASIAATAQQVVDAVAKVATQLAKFVV